METLFGTLFFVIVLIASIAIVLAGRDKNEFIYSGIIAILMNLSNILNLFYGQVSFLVLLIAIVISYCCSLIAYKIVNSLDPNSVILYIIEWELFYNVPFNLITIILGSL